MASRIPDLELNLGAFVALGSIVSVEDGRFIERGERLLGPRHDDGGFANGSVTHEDKLHVVLLILIDDRLVIRYHLHHLSY